MTPLFPRSQREGARPRLSFASGPVDRDMPRSLTSVLSRPVLKSIAEHLPVGLMVITARLRVIAISGPACDLLGRPREELEGRSISAIIRRLKLKPVTPQGKLAELSDLPMVRACTTGEVIKNEQWSFEGKDEVILVNAAPIRDEDGHIVGGMVAWTDVSGLKAVERGLRESVATETALLRESNHRIKNHLQMLSGLVQMEAQRPGITAHELAASMEERLSVLAAAHEGFYSARHPGTVNAAGLLEWVVRALNSPKHPILTCCPPDLDFDDRQVTPVALAINEAVSNALKHAFPDGREGMISVSIVRDGSTLILDIEDEGKGLPEQLRPGLGTQILGVLARQLGGTFTLQNRSTRGSVTRLVFPERPEGA